MTARILVVDRSPSLETSVRNAVAGVQPGAEVVGCTRFADVADVVTELGPFDTVVAGPALMTRAGLNRLAALHDDDPGLGVILLSAGTPEVHLRDIVQVGAIDLLTAPPRSAELADALHRALTRRRAVGSAGGPVRHRHGATFTVSSATGGCGKTFYATNLAYYLARHTGRRVCIADFDLQFGEVTSALRLRPRFTSFDLIERPTDEDLAANIEEYLVAHETGTWVLPAPKDPSEADRFQPSDVIRIIDALRTQFDYVIVDTPAQLSEVVLAAFDRSDVLFTLATLDLPSVRNMGVFLTTLQRLKIPSENIRLILNKAESNVGIEVDQVVRLFPQGFSSILPYAKEVSRSINLGLPVLASTPSSEISRKLAEGMAPFLPEGAMAPAIVEPRRTRQSVVKRMLRRHVAVAPVEVSLT